MSAPIDSLFQLSPRDRAGVPWSPRFERVTITSAASSQTAPTIETPPDVVFFITGIRLLAQSAGVALVERLRMFIIDLAGNIILEPIGVEFVATVPTESINSPLDLCIVGGVHRIAGRANFDATLVGNAIEMDLWGYQVPRGNMALP